MKTISLWQPWATLLAAGAKRIETRSWPYRGRLPVVLAVHAAKRWAVEQEALQYDEPFLAALRGIFGDRPKLDNWPLPMGCVVGLVRVKVCIPTGEFGRMPPDLLALLTGDRGERERAFGDYSPGRFAWVCDRFHALPAPTPLRGMQGVFEWGAPPEVEAVAAGWMAGEGGAP